MTMDRPSSIGMGSTRIESGGAEPTIGQLVASASEDISALVRGEIALAKAEVGFSAKQAALGGAFFGVAGYMAFLASILLTISLAYGLIALGLLPWAAFLIVAVLFLLLAGIFAFLGKKRAAKVRPPKQTIDSVKKTVAVVKPAA